MHTKTIRTVAATLIAAAGLSTAATVVATASAGASEPVYIVKPGH